MKKQELLEFLSYYPLKQGLKHFFIINMKNYAWFLSYYPLKQGLKRFKTFLLSSLITRFLSYYPLKQGLKRQYRTRAKCSNKKFLSYYPLKQGLKLLMQIMSMKVMQDFYPTIH